MSQWYLVFTRTDPALPWLRPVAVGVMVLFAADVASACQVGLLRAGEQAAGAMVQAHHLLPDDLLQRPFAAALFCVPRAVLLPPDDCERFGISVRGPDVLTDWRAAFEDRGRWRSTGRAA